MREDSAFQSEGEDSAFQSERDDSAFQSEREDSAFQSERGREEERDLALGACGCSRRMGPRGLGERQRERDRERERGRMGRCRRTVPWATPLSPLALCLLSLSLSSLSHLSLISLSSLSLTHSLSPLSPSFLSLYHSIPLSLSPASLEQQGRVLQASPHEAHLHIYIYKVCRYIHTYMLGLYHSPSPDEAHLQGGAAVI